VTDVSYQNIISYRILRASSDLLYLQHMLTKDDLKAILDTMSPFIDARARTTETLLKAEITSSEERTKKELRAEIQSTKEELRAEILAARAEAKVDALKVQTKLDKVARDHAERIEELEKDAGIPHPHKH